MQVGRGPARHLDQPQDALLDERGDGARPVGRAEPEIVAEVGQRGEAERLRGQLDQGFLRGRLVRGR